MFTVGHGLFSPLLLRYRFRYVVFFDPCQLHAIMLPRERYTYVSPITLKLAVQQS